MNRTAALSLNVVFAAAALCLSTAASAQQRPTTRPTATSPAALPAGVAGEWFWGHISPIRYWDRDTGDFVGHGYSGALTYEFKSDGTYRRFFYLETRLGGDVSGIFSASEGTVAFTGDTFTLKPTKGTYRFTDGRKKRERAMAQDELERPGLVWRWRLERKGPGGEPTLMVNKPGEEPGAFEPGRD